MSTDITIAEPVGEAYHFDDFVRDEVPAVARAVSVIADDPALASAALTAGLRSVHDSWPQVSGPDEGQRQVFGVAAAHCFVAVSTGQANNASSDVLDQPNPVSSMLRRSCLIARHNFGWSQGEIAAALGIESDEVVQQFDVAPRNVLPGQAGDELRQLVADAPAAQFVLDAITDRDPADRRGRITRTAVGAIAALFLLGALAQFVARPDRADLILEPAPVATQPPTPRASVAEAPVAPTPIEPTLIATDGAGGFVGVRPPSGLETTAVFSRSLDGQDWRAVGTWDVGSSVTFTRFERSGQTFAVWIDESDRPGSSPITMLATSSNLSDWSVLELTTDDVQPNGLLYESYISDVSISGDNVLALVRTNIEIDFAAFLLSEGYTCGHSITDEAVTINMCSYQLDVVDMNQVERLPEPRRLFVSRSGQPFERASEPFGRQTTARLTTVDGAFAITDETGVRFATSRDATTWQSIPVGRPSVAVLAAATGNENHVVGVGRSNDRSLVVFRSIGSSTNTTPLTEIIGEMNGDIEAFVAAGPTRWVIYVFDQHTSAWILTSRDGLSWTALPTSRPRGNHPRLLAGDDEVLLQWADEGGQVITLRVPFS